LVIVVYIRPFSWCFSSFCLEPLQNETMVLVIVHKQHLYDTEIDLIESS